jgi:REP element-mobilizing transposase RayT
LYKYIADIITVKEQKSLAVNGRPDHVHLLVGLKPSMRVSDLVPDIKNNSSNFINEPSWSKAHFSWQEGYSVFSYSQPGFGSVIEYNKNQKQHNKKITFRQEYLPFLKISIYHTKRNYLFEFFE